MIVEIELPKIVHVTDYHDFDELQRNFQILNESINVVELGLESIHAPGMNEYVGIVFIEQGEEYDALVKWATEEYRL